MASASGTLAPSPRIDDVAEAVAHQVHGQREQRNDGSRHDHGPPVAEGGQVQPDVRDHPELGDERVAREEADEGQCREDENHRPDVEGNLDEDRRDDVRQDVPEHDLEATGPRGPRALDERGLFRRQGQAPSVSRVQRPPDDDQRERHVEQGAPDHKADGQREDEKRHREEHVGDAHDDFIEPLAEVARDDSDQGSDRRTDEDDEEGNRDVDPDRLHRKLEQVDTADPGEPGVLGRAEDTGRNLDEERVPEEHEEDDETCHGGLVCEEDPRGEFHLIETGRSLGHARHWRTSRNDGPHSPHSYRIRGSRKAYRMSKISVVTTRMSPKTSVEPITAPTSPRRKANVVHQPMPLKVKMYSMTTAPPKSPETR